jgi:hypothetical protein
LKQARQRVSRRFLNDGARSSLPQYRQINFSLLGLAPEDRIGRGTTFLIFERGVPFGLAAAVFFFGGPGDSPINPSTSCSLSMLMPILLLSRDFGVPGVLETHCSDAAIWEVD